MMARRKIIHHVTFYRVIHDLAHENEFGCDAVLDRWYDYSPFTVPTKNMLAPVLRAQPMLHIVTPHAKADRTGRGNKRPQTYRVCPEWLAENPLDEILRKSNRGRVEL